MDPKIDYQVVSLDSVVSYFVKAFEAPPGREIFNSEHFIDPVKGKVVFKLYTHDVPASLSGEPKP